MQPAAGSGKRCRYGLIAIWCPPTLQNLLIDRASPGVAFDWVSRHCRARRVGLERASVTHSRPHEACLGAGSRVLTAANRGGARDRRDARSRYAATRFPYPADLPQPCLRRPAYTIFDLWVAGLRGPLHGAVVPRTVDVHAHIYKFTGAYLASLWRSQVRTKRADAVAKELDNTGDIMTDRLASDRLPVSEPNAARPELTTASTTPTPATAAGRGTPPEADATDVGAGGTATMLLAAAVKALPPTFRAMDPVSQTVVAALLVRSVPVCQPRLPMAGFNLRPRM